MIARVYRGDLLRWFADVCGDGSVLAEFWRAIIRTERCWCWVTLFGTASTRWECLVCTRYRSLRSRQSHHRRLIPQTHRGIAAREMPQSVRCRSQWDTAERHRSTTNRRRSPRPALALIGVEPAYQPQNEANGVETKSSCCRRSQMEEAKSMRAARMDCG